MSWLGTIRDELIGLFVDDGRFAALIVIWVALCALALPRLGLTQGVPAGLLFAGLAVLLVESAVRRSRSARRP